MATRGVGGQLVPAKGRTNLDDWAFAANTGRRAVLGQPSLGVFKGRLSRTKYAPAAGADGDSRRNRFDKGN